MVDKKCEIIERSKQGESVPYLADTLGIGQQTVWDIIKKSGQD
jgi:biotin operon repressor